MNMHTVTQQPAESQRLELVAPQTTLREAALSYAKRDWHVFPIHWPINGKCSCGKADCDPKAKHPLTQHGVNDATTDPKTISKWVGEVAVCKHWHSDGSGVGYHRGG